VLICYDIPDKTDNVSALAMLHRIASFCQRRKGGTVASAEKSLRRQPRQDRSRERIDDILKAAITLIGEKGSAAVTMRDIARSSGMPLPSIYHYFPSKTAVIATLYKRYCDETRQRIADAVAHITCADEIDTAAQAIINGYYQRICNDPTVQDLLSAIQADKALLNIDIEETRWQAHYFCHATWPHIAEDDHQDYARSVHLLFQLASAAIRLALTESEEDGARIVSDFLRLIRSQIRQFKHA
jgi:AcrR family transcriptional regulator